MNMQLLPPNYRAIEQAADKISEFAYRTPLLRNFILDEMTGARVFIKPECLQRTGSFKFRGAYNAISQLSAEQRKSGVVACSSGNHAQGVAEAARLLGAPAIIVMPTDTPKIKLARTRRAGAEIVTYDRQTQDREEIALEIVKAKGMQFIHPYENPQVIAGQGTAGLEIAKDLEAMGHGAPDHVLVGTGGGGLLAGISLAIHHHFPDAQIHSVEPEGFDDYKRSLAADKRVENASPSGSICDSIITIGPGELSFEINKHLVGEGLVVSDTQALAAIKFAWEELKLTVEPGGGVALAWVLANPDAFRDKTVVITLTGGNLDDSMLKRALDI